VSISEANAAFWNEPCGTALARSIGITTINRETLARFDDAYFAMYPYLRGYVDSLDLANKRVLEIGVGYGTLGQYVAERAAGYQAIDIADEPVGLLQLRLGLIGRPIEGVTQGSALDVPLPDQSVDAVISIGCLHHTGDLRRAVDEVHRVLTPGGAALVMVYNRYSLRRLINVPRAYMRAFRTGRNAAEAIRLMYDGNSSGEAAPHTDFVSAGGAGRLFGRFRGVRVDRRNFDDYSILRRRIALRRAWFLGWADRLVGLDLYITAVR